MKKKKKKTNTVAENKVPEGRTDENGKGVESGRAE
jgi:hypothetical protein